MIGRKHNAFCIRCNKPYYAVPVNIRTGRSKYCSKDCAGAARRNRIETDCLVCGQKMLTRPSIIEKGWGKYCSHKCRDIARDVKRVVNCLICGKEKIVNQGMVTKGWGKYCGSVCQSKGMIGENNPSWKGGLHRCDLKKRDWKEIRVRVYERDQYLCQSCGTGNVTLSAHHKIPWRISKDNSMDNLVSLCKPCHGSIESLYNDGLSFIDAVKMYSGGA